MKRFFNLSHHTVTKPIWVALMKRANRMCFLNRYSLLTGGCCALWVNVVIACKNKKKKKQISEWRWDEDCAKQKKTTSVLWMAEKLKFDSCRNYWSERNANSMSTEPLTDEILRNLSSLTSFFLLSWIIFQLFETIAEFLSSSFHLIDGFWKLINWSFKLKLCHDVLKFFFSANGWEHF